MPRCNRHWFVPTAGRCHRSMFRTGRCHVRRLSPPKTTKNKMKWWSNTTNVDDSILWVVWTHMLSLAVLLSKLIYLPAQSKRNTRGFFFRLRMVKPKTALTLAPIWLPHWPACRWTISLILRRKVKLCKNDKSSQPRRTATDRLTRDVISAAWGNQTMNVIGSPARQSNNSDVSLVGKKRRFGFWLDRLMRADGHRSNIKYNTKISLYSTVKK